MARRASFMQLQGLLQQISNEETVLALDIARRRSAGLSSSAYPPDLVGIIFAVPEQGLECFTALLSLRALQIESIAAQKRTDTPPFSEGPHCALD
jgi:hypothetical protein